MAYKIGERKDVLLPVMPCLDAFILSHTVEPVDAPSSDEVADFIGKYEPHAMLDPDNPMAIGTFTPPEYIQELRYQNHVAMENAKKAIKEVTKEFASKFGRDYHGLIEEYKCDDAEVVLITVGTVTGTAREVVDKLRQQGKKVGLIKLRFYRPFPREELRNIAKNVEAIGVYDRAISYGSGGPLFIETRNALYGMDVPVLNFLAGLGGRDVMTGDVEKMYEILMKAKDSKPAKEIYWIGTRGVSI